MDSTSIFFSVLIVNYNGGHYLKEALRSLACQTRRDFEVILLDNASSDTSLDDIDTTGLPAFTLMREPENHGFARGNNLAAGKAAGKWLVLLNPDAVAEPDWLLQLGRAIERYPFCNVFASTQILSDQPTHLDGVGDAYLGLGFPWRGGFGRPVLETPAEGTCFSPCGAGALYRKETFLAFGGFEESYFCYCEDVELGFRMTLAGETSIFLPDARIFHHGSAISGRHSAFSIYYGTRNRIWTYLRCMPSLLFWPTLPAHLALTAYLLVRHSLMGQGAAARRGIAHGFTQFRQARKAGASLRKARKISLPDLARTMAWNPMRMNQRKSHVRELPQQAMQGNL